MLSDVSGGPEAEPTPGLSPEQGEVTEFPGIDPIEAIKSGEQLPKQGALLDISFIRGKALAGKIGLYNEIDTKYGCSKRDAKVGLIQPSMGEGRWVPFVITTKGEGEITLEGPEIWQWPYYVNKSTINNTKSGSEAVQIPGSDGEVIMNKVQWQLPKGSGHGFPMGDNWKKHENFCRAFEGKPHQIEKLERELRETMIPVVKDRLGITDEESAFAVEEVIKKIRHL